MLCTECAARSTICTYHHGARGWVRGISQDANLQLVMLRTSMYIELGDLHTEQQETLVAEPLQQVELHQVLLLGRRSNPALRRLRLMVSVIPRNCPYWGLPACLAKLVPPGVVVLTMVALPSRRRRYPFFRGDFFISLHCWGWKIVVCLATSIAGHSWPTGELGTFPSEGVDRRSFCSGPLFVIRLDGVRRRRVTPFGGVPITTIYPIAYRPYVDEDER